MTEDAGPYRLNNSQLTLGSLIAALETLPNRDDYVQFDFCEFVPGEVESYRGCYDELALVPDGPSEKTVGNLIAQLKELPGDTMIGPNGDGFLVTNETPVWASYHGQASGTVITGVGAGDYMAILETAYVDP